MPRVDAGGNVTPTTVLTKNGACADALKWVSKRRSPKAAWDACERGDWLLWIAARVVKREIVVFAACQCARLALKHTKDPRVLDCIETTEAWTRGKRTIADVRKGRSYAAYAAAYASANAAAANAAYAAAYAAYAAYAADAAYAAYAAARSKTQKECARIVRKHIPWKLVQTQLEGIK